MCNYEKFKLFHLINLRRHRAKAALSAAAGPRVYAVLTEGSGEDHDAGFRAVAGGGTAIWGIAGRSIELGLF